MSSVELSLMYFTGESGEIVHIEIDNSAYCLLERVHETSMGRPCRKGARGTNWSPTGPEKTI